MKTLLFSLVLVLILCLIISGCGNDVSETTSSTTPTTTNTTAASSTTSAATQSGTPKSGGILRIGSMFSPTAHVGWPLDTNTQSIWLVNYHYAEPLVLYHFDGKIEPFLAESWDYSNNNRTITFHIRHGVKFQDGTDFNAEAVKFIMDANVEADVAFTKNWESIKVLDEYTLELTLLQFTNSLWIDLTSTSMMFVSPTNVQQNGLEYARQHPVGTGPFILTEFVPSEYAKFVRNDNYWQPGKPYLDGIEYTFIAEAMTQQAALQAGEVDLLTLQTGKAFVELTGKGFKGQVVGKGANFLAPDSANPDSPYADKKVRMAVEHAIDKEDIVSTIGWGIMVTNNQLIPSEHPAYNPDVENRTYDPDKAKQLLAEAGYPNGFNTSIISWGSYRDESIMIVEMLKAVGINAEINYVDNAKFWEYAKKGWNNALLNSGYAYGPNLAYNVRLNFPIDSTNLYSLRMPDGIDELTAQALATADVTEQKKLNQQLIKMMSDDATVIVTESNKGGFILAPYIEDFDGLYGIDYQSWRPDNTWLNK